MNCSDSFALGFLCDAWSYISVAQQTEWWHTLAFVFSLAFGLFVVGRFWIAFRTYSSQKQKTTTGRLLEQTSLIKSFQNSDITAAQSDFIIPYCSNVDPSNQDDLRNTVGVRQNVFEVLWNELENGGKCHILVLADSGMGKTTLLLNLWGKEQNKSLKKQRRIALVPLGQDNAIDQIKSISDQRNTILLLDAFDEDVRAIENAAERMGVIMEAASDFKSVVMTCRTQFFPSDNEIPRDTGVKRVSARRAGVSTIYQWRTVYLLPFDSSQISNFIKVSIPWYKPSQRRKASRIVEEISDLAARPMLATLIPELAESNSEAHGLWDLYVFMVDSWVKRESSWIDPQTLKNLSKTLAVDLVLNRNIRNSERILLSELLQVLSLSNQAFESWKLTGRSLLNRDAAGHYKFAHRSIMEFLFIQGLVEGDDRCITVAWTDMMCQLFLSWGNSEKHDTSRASQILESDLRPTLLFPLNIRHEQLVNLDAVWAKKIFSERSHMGARSKFPMHWRANVSHVKQLGDLVRVYDFAEGLVWQLQCTNKIEYREERDVYKVDRFTYRGAEDWIIPDLLEIYWLVEILGSLQLLAQVIDDRELYWIADTDGIYHAVTRIRIKADSESVSYPNLSLVYSANGMAGTMWYSIDILKANLRGKNTSDLLALPIMTFHGDAEAIWHRDKGADRPSDWAIPLDTMQRPHVRF